MTNKAPMRVSVITVVLFASAMAIALWPAGGWAEKHESGQAEFTPTMGQQFGARSSPAKATSDDDATMKSKGYFKIGTISATHAGKKSGEKVTGELESAILRKAAEVGGDYVHFEKEGEIKKVEVPKTRSRCTNTQTIATSNFSCNPNANCYTDIHGFQHCNGSCGSTSGTRSQCIAWGPPEVVGEKIELSLISVGTVWRFDSGIMLFKAVAAHQVEGLKQALQQGASVNSVDDEGFTVLHRALMESQPDLVQTLLENGADVNVAIKSGAYEGITPLMMASAASGGWVEPLLMRGAKVDATDKNGRQAFAYAVAGGNVETIKLLASHGVNLNWQSERGETYLMLAAESAQGESAKALIELGANRSLKDKDGMTAADIAKLKMTQLEKEDSFTKDFRVRWQAIEAVLYASEDQDRHDAIISSAQDWLTHIPNDPDAYLWLARGYSFAPSDLRKAAENYEAVIRNAAKSQSTAYLLHEARLILPECYDGAQQWQNAANAHEDAVREFPADAHILNSAAWFYATTKSALRNPRKALEYANRAIAAAPDDPNIVDTLAEAYFINGRIASAIATEQKALALAPDRKDIQKDMEKYRRAQRAAQAKKTPQPLPK
jgi:tetratricopeptide (TPR) repeat protein